MDVSLKLLIVYLVGMVIFAVAQIAENAFGREPHFKANVAGVALLWPMWMVVALVDQVRQGRRL